MRAAASRSGTPSPSFFAKLGVLILPDFLESPACLELIEEMRAAPRRNASITLRGEAQEVVDGRRRRTAHVEVSEGTATRMLERLRGLRPRMEDFFGLSLSQTLEAPKFLLYQPGDFFVAHRDVPAPKTQAIAPIIEARRVNLIVSVNEESDGKNGDGYAGAALTLYGLIDQPRWRTYGFPVRAPAGSLVAFRSDVLHEVAPITSGERYSVVSRMLDADYRAG